MKGKVKVTGHKKLIQQLKKLGSKTTAKKINRRAATKAIKPLQRGVKDNLPEDTGALVRASAKKVKSKGFGVSAKVGENANYTGEDGSQPVHYVHLVERGYQLADGTTVPGQFPIARATEDTREQVVEIYAHELEAGIAAAVKGG